MKIQGLDDFMKNPLPNVIIDNEDLIEGIIDENNSFIYNIKEKNYYIYSFDSDELEEIAIYIDEDFDGLSIDGVEITKEDFNNFKEVIDNYNLTI